jgi:hypothetical protein
MIFRMVAIEVTGLNNEDENTLPAIAQATCNASMTHRTNTPAWEGFQAKRLR